MRDQVGGAVLAATAAGVVAADRNAIGYVDVDEVDDSVRAVLRFD